MKTSHLLATLLFSLAYTTTSIACTQATQKNQNQLFVATILDNSQTIDDLYSKYCFQITNNSPIIPMFFSKSLNAFKSHLTQNNSVSTRYTGGSLNFDPISYFLISKEVEARFASINTEMEKRELSKFIEDYKELNPTSPITYELLKEKNVSWDKINEIVLYIMEKQQKNAYASSKIEQTDIFGNISLAYIIQKGAINPLNTVSKSYTYERLLTKKNHDLLSPLHLMFNLQIDTGSQESNEATLQKLNQIIISKLEHSPMQLNYLKFNGNSFFAFAEIMKDNNPEFYQKLKQKYPKADFSNTKPEETKKKFLNISNYPKKAVALLFDYK